MKLSSQLANKHYGAIKQISESNCDVREKLVGSNDTSLNRIFSSVIATLSTGFEGKFKERIQYVLNDNEKIFGPIIKNDVQQLGTSLFSFFTNKKTPNANDFKVCVRRLAQFIATSSDVPIPDEVTAIYENQSRKMTFEPDDLIDNPTTRVPVVLCLDTSGSMSVDNKIGKLHQAVKKFFYDIQNDETAKYALELCIISFDFTAKKLLDFSTVINQTEAFQKVNLIAHGQTAMGEAVNMAVDLVEKRKAEYKSKGVDYWQPWMVLMTDGVPTDDISAAAQRVSDLVNNGKLVVFPIGIGDDANMEVLAKFSPKNSPLKMRGLEFAAFFQWLGKSVQSTSRSSLGTRINLPPTKDWSL